MNTGFWITIFLTGLLSGFALGIVSTIVLLDATEKVKVEE